MTDIAKLKQEAEDCKTKLTLGVARLVAYGVPDDKIVQFLEVFRDYVTARQALQAAEREAEACKYDQSCFECNRSHPHEDMTPECEKKSIEAKAANADTHTWIKWEGDGFPVANRLTRVQAIWRSGYLTGDDMAFNFDWRHNGGKADIIAYRIISPAADRVSE